MVWIEHGRSPAHIGQWLDSPAGRGTKSVDDVVIDQVRCIVKRRPPGLQRGISYVLRYSRAFLIAIFCKLFLGEFPRPGVLLRNGLDDERERLGYLLDRNIRVPAVWWHGPGVLVLEHVGTDFVDFLCEASPSRRIALIEHAAADLAAFHRQGLWHGGAQLRNLVMRDDEIWRIDFEENIGGALSLPLAQAYDLYQMLSSLLALGDIGPDEFPVLAQSMLQTYFAAHSDPAVHAQATRMARVLNRCAAVMRPLRGKVSGRDVEGFFRAADALRLLLRP